MNRRELLAAIGAAALTANAAKTHAHGFNPDFIESLRTDANPYGLLVTAAGHCIGKGEICLAFCLSLMGKGNTELASCAQSVNQMLALTRAIQDMAGQQAPLIDQAAAVCLEACESCRKACEPYAGRYAKFRACAQACAECAFECRALVA
ncbi:Csp1 family four helix bundle copper storage protein [Betaproteobacteria bacterium SCN1]|jgi:Cys-rich four helix bundle protein (predicted Tat secretion target)|nr:Csp1 family four helix bundle copper storage protein [Betaproteobacteria bacterium SCN1]MBN8759547.1 Csp1 family four helix bundle copper storage protein [Thiobacillus sp.]ODU89734.1 MAG: hypothetical protein ABT21_08570 [Thiobacillus sp. SCN 65-179]OJW37662.1 MAG: hypothetical protein BGO61_04900 [Thiobacillus sp. 65-69]